MTLACLKLYIYIIYVQVWFDYITGLSRFRLLLQMVMCWLGPSVLRLVYLIFS